jgi:hypothetical protein
VKDLQMKNTIGTDFDNGALDHQFIVTQFPNLGAKTKQELPFSSRDLAAKIESAKASHKRKLQLLSGVAFGNVPTEKKSLRSRANATKVYAVFVDYDAGEVSLEEAAEMLRKEGVAALFYTTPSHGLPGKGSRWRAVFVLSMPRAPDAYADLVARVNGLFGGALADESFDFWQSYFFGSVDGQRRVETLLVNGHRCLDAADDLDASAIGPSRPSSATMEIEASEAEDQSDLPGAVKHAQGMRDWAVSYILDSVNKGQSRTRAIFKQAFHLGGYLACSTLSEDGVRDALIEAADETGYLTDYSESDLERHISKGINSGMTRPLHWHDPLDDLPDFDAKESEVEGPILAGELAEIDELVGMSTDAPAKAEKPKVKVDAVTERLNEKYAVVRHGGKTWVAEFSGEKIDIGPVEQLHAFHANDLVPTGTNGGLQAASRHWLRSPGRRQYSGIVFDPTEQATGDGLNLYSGLALQPNPKSSCERILAHIREVIAAGNEAHFCYIIGWLADILQRPGQKPGVALVLRGGKGVGKDTLAVVMGKIIGRKHVAHIIRPEDLTGRFNAPFATALLVHVEEAFWSGDAGKKGTLQALITAPTQPIERKGIDRIEVDSFLRVLMTTNDEWAVPASEDERRYAVFDVADVYRRDPKWFDPLYEEIEGDGPAAFLAYLLAVDLFGVNLRDVPQTNALRDQKIASLRGLPKWWFGLLDRGNFAGYGEDGDWSAPITVEKEALRSSYEFELSKSRFGGDPVGPAQFTKELKKLLCDELEETRPRSNGRRPCMFVLPALSICRDKAAEWLQAPVEWHGADEAGEDDLDADDLI